MNWMWQDLLNTITPQGNDQNSNTHTKKNPTKRALMPIKGFCLFEWYKLKLLNRYCFVIPFLYAHHPISMSVVLLVASQTRWAGWSKQRDTLPCPSTFYWLCIFPPCAAVDTRDGWKYHRWSHFSFTSCR